MIKQESHKCVLGLDVSTTCIGVCVYDGSHINLDNLQFKDCGTLFEKTDKAKKFLSDLKSEHNVSDIFVEEALIGFRQGASSAQTITMLVKFNALVSYAARDVFSIEPKFVSATSARKACGIKMQRPSKCGISQKDQVFNHMAEYDLKTYPWPLKKSGKIVDWAKDATDAYVIAKTGYLQICTP